MYIQFNHLKFKNINSYGNQETLITFKKGLNFISGKIGQGKSTIQDSLCFCLFGSPYRKIKIKELINRTNKKKLLTQVSFNIDKDNYLVTRGLKPDIFTIEKNKKPLELLSSKRLNQEELDKILGLNLTLFKQVISLATNYNKPFLSLYANEKRDIIENIFNIKIFGLMLKTIKTKQSILKTDLELNNKTLSLLEKNIKESYKQIKKLTLTRKNFNKDKLNEKQELEKTLALTRKKIKTSEKNLDVLKEDIKKLEKEVIPYKNLLEKKETLNQKIGSLKGKKSSLLETLDLFKNNNTCPVCSSNISKEHKKEHIEVSYKEFRAQEVLLEKSLKDKEKIQEEIDKINSLKDNLNDKNNLLFREQNNIKHNKELITRYEKSLEQINNREFNFDLENMKDSFEKSKKEYKETFKKISSLKKEISINEILFTILGDEGIKSHFFSKLVPVLNRKVNEYLKKFDIPIYIEFNEYMEEHITTFGKHKDVSYMSFSEGEKKRIDISILLSFIETTKVISGWSTNLLFLDELLDSITDEDGRYIVMDSIRNMVDNDKNLCLYVISHKFNDFNSDNMYHVEKVGGFSRITEKKHNV